MEIYKDTEVAEDIQNRTGKNVIIVRKVGVVYFNVFKEPSEVLDYIKSLKPNPILYSDNYISMNLVGCKCVIQFINATLYYKVKEQLTII